MCFASKPKIIQQPTPVKAPIAPNKPAEVSRKPRKLVKKDGASRRRGTQRGQLVVPPSGVNRGGSGGTGVYS